MEAKTIQKYSKYSTPKLRLMASKRFRAWIRRRDEGKPCISCGSFNTSDASHYYSAGHYPELEHEPDNCHLACKKCNMFLSGNLIEYRKGLLKRIGLERLQRLDETTAYFKVHGYKHDRLNLIQKIEQFK